MMTDEQYNKLVESNFGVPPAWCKDAVATDHGWVNPRTKEIYSCIPKLKTRIEEFMAEQARRYVPRDNEPVADDGVEIVTEQTEKPKAVKKPAAKPKAKAKAKKSVKAK